MCQTSTAQSAAGEKSVQPGAPQSLEPLLWVACYMVTTRDWSSGAGSRRLWIHGEGAVGGKQGIDGIALQRQAQRHTEKTTAPRTGLVHTKWIEWVAGARWCQELRQQWQYTPGIPTSALAKSARCARSETRGVRQASSAICLRSVGRAVELAIARAIELQMLRL